MSCRFCKALWRHHENNLKTSSEVAWPRRIYLSWSRSVRQDECLQRQLKQFNCYTKKWVCISGFLAYRKFWRSTVFKTTHFSFSIVIILNIVTSSSNCYCHQNDNEFLREHMRECCLCKNWLYSKKEKGVRYLSSVTQYTDTPHAPHPKKQKAKTKQNKKQPKTNKQTNNKKIGNGRKAWNGLIHQAYNILKDIPFWSICQPEPYTILKYMPYTKHIHLSLESSLFLAEIFPNLAKF